MSYRTILVPVGQPENAESAIEAAFLVARRFAGHVHGLHVLPDLANPVTHALIATRMSLERRAAICGSSAAAPSASCSASRASSGGCSRRRRRGPAPGPGRPRSARPALRVLA